MRVIHVISGISRSSGGPARSSQGLVAALNAAGVEAWLVSCAVGERPWLSGVTRFRAPDRPGLWALRAFFRDLFEELRPDLVHLHGIWQPQIHLAACAARALGIPYIIAPRGMLDPWAMRQKWWKKCIAWVVYQKADLRKAVALQATAELEATHIRRNGFRQPLLVIPNGVAVPARLPMREATSSAVRTALFLSRLHPGKRLLDLAEAWGRVRPTGWRMRVVGFDNYGEKARVQARLKTLGVSGEWTFEDALDDEAKWQAYVDADLFLHPSVSENFGISIAEALYAGLPVVATTGTPWQELVAEGCGWWIAPTLDALAETLGTATSLPSETLREMGMHGHALIARNYVWSAIGTKMAKAYRELP